MRKADRIGVKVFNYINIVIMTSLVLATAYPMLFVTFASLSRPIDFITHKGILLKPLGFNLTAYKLVFENPMIVRGYLNTLFVVFVGVTLNIALTSLGAYFLSRKGILWKNLIMLLIIFTMYFSGGLIPFYFTVKQLGIDNTLWVLIFPVAISTFNLIIMRTSFMAIPDSMEESAKLDGANHFTILFRIFLPLSLPTVAVMILYYGVAHWNAWFNAMIFIRKRELFPLQLILREILIQNQISEMTIGSDPGEKQMIGEIIKYALVIVATAPVLTLYPFLQKYFVKGVMIGALKG